MLFHRYRCQDWGMNVFIRFDHIYLLLNMRLASPLTSTCGAMHCIFWSNAPARRETAQPMHSMLPLCRLSNYSEVLNATDYWLQYGFKNSYLFLELIKFDNIILHF